MQTRWGGGGRHCRPRIPDPVSAPSGGGVSIQLKVAVSGAWLLHARPPHFGAIYYTTRRNTGLLSYTASRTG